MHCGAWTLLAVWAACAQQPDPAYAPLARAYDALRVSAYEDAVAQFLQAVEAAPARPSIRKDLAYTYLKIGEAEAAREQFAEAMRLDPADLHVALEYAFLCYETRERATARRIFDRIRKTGEPAARATAEQAFQNVDRPLAEGIARWLQALALNPEDFGSHVELARLAEERDELELAAEHFHKAWRLRPAERPLLVDLGRVWKAMGKAEQAHAALLAASRGAEPHAAEKARGLLPPRYPYVYEFRQALELDPRNVELRRELAYLLLEMNLRAEAEQEFNQIVETAPEDLLSAAQLGFLRLHRKDLTGATPLLKRVLEGPDEELADRVRLALALPRTLRRRPETPRRQVTVEAKVLGERSYQAGYLRDALKYLTIAHESDPADFPVMLKLGWTHNLLRQDSQAIRWFDLARRSPEQVVAAEASKAYHGLRPAFARFRTSAWLMPFYSSRWRDVFSYGQVKTEVNFRGLPLRPYFTTRFIGDTRRTTGGVLPQYLSESSLILGVGLVSTPWRGVVLWGEAGTAVSYASQRPDVGRMMPDYRGGLAYGRGLGHLLGGESSGGFFETNKDAVFLSRFGDDFLIHSQNRFGYTPRPLAGLATQFYWNANAALDFRRQYWANFVEFGPGFRFRWQGMPEALVFSVNLLRGVHTLNRGNPRRPNFFDVRAGFWYAASH
ncbi:MAG: tetratricopeptide repeat protein [Acidobacteriota bacterium]